ncbi:hypothetical protein NP493_39g03028 [Ridgeia piscesae]|uniref:Uncharacterized protein n=1 Tax=Ridgeia piscesae TaxID=27915 RepID=A0AAD9UK06_RIDPI|nr:hypothetical protein NP493_39g03028 [Ridgeia piscesae]
MHTFAINSCTARKTAFFITCRDRQTQVAAVAMAAAIIIDYNV